MGFQRLAIVVTAGSSITGLPGRIYSNQVGGHACKQVSVVGFEYLECQPEERAEAFDTFLMNYFNSAKCGGWGDRGLDEDTCLVIDAVLGALLVDFGGVWGMDWLVDREKMGESMQAWVWVENKKTGSRGVLMWENSD